MEYRIADDPRQLRLARRAPFQIHVRQLFQGEIIGGAGILLVPVKSRRDGAETPDMAAEETVLVG